MACVQLYQVPLSKPFDDTSIQDLSANFAKADGLINVTWALQHEDNKIVGIAVHWANHERYATWATPEQKKAITQLLDNLSSGPIYEDIVVFPGNAGPALAAPVVELVSWIYPSKKVDSDTKTQIAKGFSVFANAIVSEAPEAAGGTIGGWGQIDFEHEGILSKRYTALIGWKSVEAHYACKETPPFQKNIHNIMEHNHTGLEMVHYAYSQSSEK